MLGLSFAPEIVFVMGLPAAGKSTWITKYLPNYDWIDPDKLKARHPDYDPHQPHRVHEWSKQLAMAKFKDILKYPCGLWVLEGTGADADEMVYNIKAAQHAGYSTSLVYVKCALNKAVVRNTYRERIIPREVILEKSPKIDYSFTYASLYANTVMEVDNNADYKEPLHLILKFMS
jgi:predicted kinase